MTTYSSYLSSPVGWLKIQCTDMAINEVAFIEETQKGATDEHPLLRQCETQLEEYFTGKRNTFELQLEQDGTAFQEKVWKLLCAIPFGKTISYNDLAKQYGDLKAIRAVAAANGRNNIAIIVPCHRVIGSNQKLVGYAGGLWRKKWLIDHEARYYAGVQQLF